MRLLHHFPLGFWNWIYTNEISCSTNLCKTRSKIVISIFQRQEFLHLSEKTFLIASQNELIHEECISEGHCRWTVFTQMRGLDSSYTKITARRSFNLMWHKHTYGICTVNQKIDLLNTLMTTEKFFFIMNAGKTTHIYNCCRTSIYKSWQHAALSDLSSFQVNAS